MSHDDLIAYCLTKPGAWQDEPWEGDLVTKVGTKIFAFHGSVAGESATAVGLKCGSDRDEADEWLERYPGDASVMAYIGRYGWNTLAVGAPSRMPRSAMRSMPRTPRWWRVSRGPSARSRSLASAARADRRALRAATRRS